MIAEGHNIGLRDAELGAELLKSLSFADSCGGELHSTLASTGA